MREVRGRAENLRRVRAAAGRALTPPLLAETGSAFLFAEAGVESTLGNSAAYLKGWLEVLKGDARLIVTATSAAQRAADFILGRNVQTRECAPALREQRHEQIEAPPQTSPP